MLSYDQLQAAVAAAKQRFGLVRKKYPDLDQKERPDYKAYLVLSLPGGQVSVDGSPKDILKKFAAMVIDGNAKTRALATLHRLRILEGNDEAGPQIEQLTKQWEQFVPQLRYDEQVHVEIRFKNLNYDTIWNLQVDDLVDRDLTPQSKASIRIVLGTLSRFI